MLIMVEWRSLCPLLKVLIHMLVQFSLSQLNIYSSFNELLMLLLLLRVCVCVCEREREREREKGGGGENITWTMVTPMDCKSLCRSVLEEVVCGVIGRVYTYVGWPRKMLAFTMNFPFTLPLYFPPIPTSPHTHTLLYL